MLLGQFSVQALAQLQVASLIYKVGLKVQWQGVKLTVRRVAKGGTNIGKGWD